MESLMGLPVSSYGSVQTNSILIYDCHGVCQLGPGVTIRLDALNE